MFYSPSIGGFYHKEIHGINMPDDVVEISNETYRELILSQENGLRIVPGDGGFPKAEAQKEASTEQKSESIRANRNRILSDCDWTQLTDSPLTSAKKSEWKLYRQLLRDIPSQEGFPDSINWPTFP